MSITAAGITVRSYEQIVSSLEQRYKLRYGETFDTTPESPDGEFIRIMASYIYDQELLAEAAYHSYNPSVVAGVGLDNLVRLNGLRRIVNSPTVASVSITSPGGTANGEVVPAGTTVATADGIEFLTGTDVTIPGETMVTCTQSGAIIIGPNEIVEFKSSVPEDVAVINHEAGVPGVVYETDPQLRARRERSLIQKGTNTAEAIYAAVADLNLEFIAVLENDTDAPVDGIPAKSFMVIADGSTLELIAGRIYQNKPFGIQAYGTSQVTVIDSKGYPHTIGITRPTTKDVYVKCEVVRPENVAIAGTRAMRDALINHVNSLPISEDVVWADMFAPATTASPQIKVKTLKISFDGITWVTTDLPIGTTERARASTATVTVVEV